MKKLCFVYVVIILELWTNKVIALKKRKNSYNTIVDLDPTVILEIPAISDADAELTLRKLGYDEDLDNPVIVSRIDGDSSELLLSQLIREFQRFNDIEETGILDDETKYLLGSPHCGSKKSAKKKKLPNDPIDDIWSKKDLTYRIRNFPRGKRAVLIRTYLTRAFEEWSKVTDLNFQEVTHNGADIEILFGSYVHDHRDDECTFDSETTMAHAFFPEVGDIHFNTLYFFQGDSTIEEFFETALHEIGHSLGLSHSRSKNSLMHPYELNGFVKPQAEDIELIQSMYGAPMGYNSVQVVAPKLCTLDKIDAALKDENGIIYLFAGDFYYNPNEKKPTGRLISSRWKGLPGDIDAAFCYVDGRSYFFKGNKCWRFKGTRLDIGYPRLISKAFPGFPTNIDAVLVDDDKDIFAFKGNQFWLYEHKLKRVDTSPGLTKQIGISTRIDAALDTETNLFLFKNKQIYEMQDDSKFIRQPNEWLTCS